LLKTEYVLIILLNFDLRYVNLSLKLIDLALLNLEFDVLLFKFLVQVNLCTFMTILFSDVLLLNILYLLLNFYIFLLNLQEVMFRFFLLSLSDLVFLFSLFKTFSKILLRSFNFKELFFELLDVIFMLLFLNLALRKLFLKLCFIGLKFFVGRFEILVLSFDSCNFFSQLLLFLFKLVNLAEVVSLMAIVCWSLILKFSDLVLESIFIHFKLLNSCLTLIILSVEVIDLFNIFISLVH